MAANIGRFVSTTTEQRNMLDPDDLRNVDRQLLAYLTEGRVTPVYARKRLKDDEVGEYSRGYVQQRLARLVEHGHAINQGEAGLYELVDDPREDAVDTDDHSFETEAARKQYAEALEDLETVKAERDAMETKLEQCREQLAAAESDVDVAALRRALDDVEAAAGRGDGNGLQQALDRAREAIDDAE